MQHGNIFDRMGRIFSDGMEFRNWVIPNEIVIISFLSTGNGFRESDMRCPSDDGTLEYGDKRSDVVGRPLDKRDQTHILCIPCSHFWAFFWHRNSCIFRPAAVQQFNIKYFNNFYHFTPFHFCDFSPVLPNLDSLKQQINKISDMISRS